jgi:hypothetical protein
MSLMITTSLPLMQDIDTYWKRQISNGSAGSVTDPVAATDTEIHVSMPSNQSVQPGDAILLDREEMTVQSIVLPITPVTYSVLTVTRGLSQMTPDGPTQFPSAKPQAHPAGVIVKVLQYSSPWVMASERWLRPGINSVAIELGRDSACLAAKTVGSAAINQ